MIGRQLHMVHLGRHRRLLGLLLLLSVLLTVAVPLYRVTLGIDLMAPVRRALVQLRASVALSLLARNDPALNSTLPSPKDMQIVQGNFEPKKFKMIVFAGPVSVCALRAIPNYEIIQKGQKNLQIIWVFASSKSEVQRAAANFRANQFVWIADPDRYYASKCNAYFYPRIYLVDPEWRILYIQNHRTSSQSAVWAAVSKLPEEVQ